MTSWGGKQIREHLVKKFCQSFSELQKKHAMIKLFDKVLKYLTSKEPKDYIHKSCIVFGDNIFWWKCENNPGLILGFMSINSICQAVKLTLE